MTPDLSLDTKNKSNENLQQIHVSRRMKIISTIII